MDWYSDDNDDSNNVYPGDEEDFECGETCYEEACIDSDIDYCRIEVCIDCNQDVTECMMISEGPVNPFCQDTYYEYWDATFHDDDDDEEDDDDEDDDDEDDDDEDDDEDDDDTDLCDCWEEIFPEGF